MIVPHTPSSEKLLGEPEFAAQCSHCFVTRRQIALMAALHEFTRLPHPIG